VTKKPRRRRHGPPAQVARPQAARGAVAGDPLDALTDLWDAIAAGDLANAEIETSTAIALPRISGEMDAGQADDFIARTMVGAAHMRGTPEAAAFLRLLVSLGSPTVKRAAGQALAHLTARNVYPADWVTQAGKAVPRRAWSKHDIFGDMELIVVTFGYGDAEHAVAAQVQRSILPVVYTIVITDEVAKLLEALPTDLTPFERYEEIGLGEARRRLEDALLRAEGDPDASATLRAYWPLAISRIRRLPEEDAPPEAAADRAAAVEEFLSSPQAEGLDTDSARFWAQVLTSYTARIAGEPPDQIGPHMLPVALLGHTPAYFTLTAAQREAMEPAVTAWVAWSAARRGFDEAASQRLAQALPEVFSGFDVAYADPDNAISRAYLADAAAPDANPVTLVDIRLRRLFTVPEDASADSDPSDSGTRHAVAEAEFGDCTPPDGMTSEEFVAAVGRVLDELWAGDPSQTWDRAKMLVASGADRHDTLHTLAARKLSPGYVTHDLDPRRVLILI
jgi:hypothetical protein